MDKIDEVLTRGVSEVIVKDSLEQKLKTKRGLIVKLGIDPSGSELHLGHSVVLRKLQEFQDLGHQAVLVIGDFTALIGDPSGRTKERKKLTKNQIEKNMETYKVQASKILDFNKVRFEYNSSWLGKMGIEEVFELASKATVAQIMERKEFRERLKQDIDIPYLEMLYPLMQGYDSVQLHADIELGGADQKFNLLMGRQIQKRYEQQEQDIVMVKLLTGTDGTKMSKSANNYVSLTSDPNDTYGKIMSIPDEHMLEYAELCTDLDLKEFKINKSPFLLKKLLAKTIVEMYHGQEAASQAEENFANVFSKQMYNENLIITQSIASGEYKPTEILTASGTTTSTVQSKVLIRAGAVSIDNIPLVVDDWQKIINLTPNQIVRVGKRKIIEVK